MRDHYVMNANSQMLFRGTYQECCEWCEMHQAQFKAYGMSQPEYRVYYDTATEPSKVYPWQQGSR